MKKCQNCNALIRDDDKFCRNCGILIPSKFSILLCNLLTFIMVMGVLFFMVLLIASYIVE